MQYRSKPLSPVRQLLLLALLLVASLILAIVGLTLLRQAGIFSDGSPVGNLLLQALYTLLLFLAPALLWARLAREQHPFSLTTPPRLAYPIALLLPLLAIPAVELLTDANHLLPATEWMRSLETRLEQSTLQMLYVQSPTRFLLNVLVVALVPAIAEEFFFRGALQHILLRVTRRPHFAIWLTAIAFALLHMQLLSLLPRILLGAALGYIYHYSRSLLASIAGHFANNFLAVVAHFFAARQGMNPEQLKGLSMHWTLGLASLLATIGALYLLRRLTQQRTGEQHPA